MEDFRSRDADRSTTGVRLRWDECTHLIARSTSVAEVQSEASRGASEWPCVERLNTYFSVLHRGRDTAATRDQSSVLDLDCALEHESTTVARHSLSLQIQY
ncbi:hypothetical protein CBL_05294 [Carabus blaptoides fortunei]